MTVISDPTGRWVVIDRNIIIAGPFDTNAQAWRWLDRHTGSPICRSESVAEWLFEQSVRRDLA
jgi:hypothetical protein